MPACAAGDRLRAEKTEERRAVCRLQRREIRRRETPALCVEKRIEIRRRVMRSPVTTGHWDWCGCRQRRETSDELVLRACGCRLRAEKGDAESPSDALGQIWCGDRRERGEQSCRDEADCRRVAVCPARLSPTQLEELKRSPGFLSCYQDAPVKKDTTHTSDFLKLSSTVSLWPAENFGDDIIIGVVDTGVRPESASYRDDSLVPVPSRWRGACEAGTTFSSSACNRKLIDARSVKRGSARATPTSPSPSTLPRTPTATICTPCPPPAGATSAARPSSGVVVSDIIAVINHANSDGVDVISLSLGIDGVPLYKDLIAIIAFAAIERGIFVSTSTGNEGPFLGLLHNRTPWVLTVGASTVDREFATAINLCNGSLVL
ncbi:hypothetical protein Cni_G26357 [Canna indica]|uniref:Peptidase S8/S53 domain-containing protein n=1 Tax=Canna indica TaxID=4628 RepID=A0AAQ3QNA8_9LILI|nr:hypothetical protein Cni_G26357 [Canna indica]